MIAALTGAQVDQAFARRTEPTKALGRDAVVRLATEGGNQVRHRRVHPLEQLLLARRAVWAPHC